MSRVSQYFDRYEKGANTFDVDIMIDQYAECFVAGTPNGAKCYQAEDFRKSVPTRKEFFAEIGFQSAKILDVQETQIDEKYIMAKVHWKLTFEKNAGQPQYFQFYITYFLFDDGNDLRMVFYISHDDEQKVMKEAGLI